jgi:hypothetical protein
MVALVWLALLSPAFFFLIIGRSAARHPAPGWCPRGPVTTSSPPADLRHHPRAATQWVQVAGLTARPYRVAQRAYQMSASTPDPAPRSRSRRSTARLRRRRRALGETERHDISPSRSWSWSALHQRGRVATDPRLRPRGGFSVVLSPVRKFNSDSSTSRLTAARQRPRYRRAGSRQSGDIVVGLESRTAKAEAVIGKTELRFRPVLATSARCQARARPPPSRRHHHTGGATLPPTTTTTVPVDDSASTRRARHATPPDQCPPGDPHRAKVRRQAQVLRAR